MDGVMPGVSDETYRSYAAIQMLHGGGSQWNSGNRWFDKTLQVIPRSMYTHTRYLVKAPISNFFTLKWPYYAFLPVILYSGAALIQDNDFQGKKVHIHVIMLPYAAAPLALRLKRIVCFGLLTMCSGAPSFTKIYTIRSINNVMMICFLAFVFCTLPH